MGERAEASQGCPGPGKAAMASPATSQVWSRVLGPSGTATPPEKLGSVVPEPKARAQLSPSQSAPRAGDEVEPIPPEPRALALRCSQGVGLAKSLSVPCTSPSRSALNGGS